MTFGQNFVGYLGKVLKKPIQGAAALYAMEGNLVALDNNKSNGRHHHSAAPAAALPFPLVIDPFAAAGTNP